MIEITSEYLASQGLNETFPQRFWSKIIKTDTCWIWSAYKNSFGYGQIHKGWNIPSRIGAHVASWIIHFGPVPSGMCVLHRCDNPTCVNPNHLWLGTLSDNNADKIAKGRQRTGISLGENHGLHKLTWTGVHAARLAYSNGESIRALARCYGVSQKAMRLCLKMQTWKLH